MTEPESSEVPAGQTAVDIAYARAAWGDPDGFADWVRLVEIPLRASLRSFARHVDVEAVVQEGLLRMWVLAPRIDLEGANASLRYALRLVRNLALREAERSGRFEPLDGNDGAEPRAAPDPTPDPALRRAILACIERLPPRPKAALLARLEGPRAEPDRTLASRLGTSVNTFLQNVVRARKAVGACLESQGIRLREVLR